MDGYRITPCPPHGLHRPDASPHASGQAPGAPGALHGGSSHPDYPRRSACVPGSRDGRAGDPVGPGDRHQVAHGWDDRAAGRREGADQRVRASAKHVGVQMRARGHRPARLAAVPAGALEQHRIVHFSLWFLIFAALVASPDPAMAQGTVTVTSVTSEAWDDPDLAADEEGARLRFTIHRTSTACCQDNDIVVSISESGGDMVPWTTKTIDAYDTQGFTSLDFAVYTVNDNEIEPDTTITLTIVPKSNYTVGTPSSQSITIRDNDSPQTPSAPRASWEHREDGILVSWETPSSTGSSAITRYEYRRRVYGDNWSRTWTSLPASARTLTFNNLGHQTKYELDVRAVNGAGGGGVARIRDLVWLRVPSPPGFRAEPGDATGTVKVSVSSGPTALGVAEYEMRWKHSDSSWDTVEPSALGDGWRYFRLGDGLYAIIGAAGFGLKLDPSVSYDFEVRSRSQHPSRGVIYGPTVSASAVAKEKPVGPFVPGSVKFSMGKPAGGKVTVAWEPPEDGGSEILRYQARKRTWAKDSGGNPTNPGNWTSTDAGDGTASARRHQFTSLSACGIYDFGIRAVNAVGNGPWGDLRVDLPGSSCAARDPTLKPIKPQDLTATPKSTSRIDLSWWWYNPEGRATSIQVQRSTTSNGPWTTKADWVTSSLDAYTDTGLTGNTLGAALLRRHPRGLTRAARQELLDRSKAGRVWRRRRIADRRCYSISV